MSLKLVVFDVDGTLVDSQLQIVAAMDAAFAAEGLPLPGRRVLTVVGLSLHLAIARLATGASPARVERMVQVYKQTYASKRGADGEALGAPFYPGARAVLDHLHAQDDVLLGLATGKSRRGLNHMVEAHGLQGYFQTAHCADDHPSKPSPGMLLAALADTGVEARRTVLVGDTTFDMQMAAGAGVRGIGVDWGYHPADDLTRAGAARVLSDFAQLPAALQEMWEMHDG